MIKREKYLTEIRGFVDSDLIKIITGIRRCGKSIILSQLKEEIEKTSNNIIYLDFENRRTRKEIPDADALLDYVDKTR